MFNAANVVFDESSTTNDAANGGSTTNNALHDAANGGSVSNSGSNNALNNASDYDLNGGSNTDEIAVTVPMQIDEATTKATEDKVANRSFPGIRLGEEILDDHIDAEPTHAHMSDTLNENESLSQFARPLDS